MSIGENASSEFGFGPLALFTSFLFCKLGYAIAILASNLTISSLSSWGIQLNDFLLLRLCYSMVSYIFEYKYICFSLCKCHVIS